MFNFTTLERQKSKISQKIHKVQDKQQHIKLSLLMRAHKLKQKLIQDTNNNDFNVQKLMAQTLKEIQYHKIKYKQQKQISPYLPKDKQIQELFKIQLIDNVQRCKNRFKQNLTRIKRNRMYTYDDKFKDKKISIQEMLKTAKDNFKSEHNNRKIMNQSMTSKQTYSIQWNQSLHRKSRKKLGFQSVLKSFNKTVSHPNKLTKNKNFNEKSQSRSPRINERSQLRSPRIKTFTFKNNKSRQQLKDIDLGILNPSQIKRSKVQKSKFNIKHHANGYYKNRTRRQILQQKKEQLRSDRTVFRPLGRTRLTSQMQTYSNQSVNKDTNIQGGDNFMPQIVKDELKKSQQILIEEQENYGNAINFSNFLKQLQINIKNKRSTDLTSLNTKYLQQLQHSRITLFQKEDFYQLQDGTNVRIATENNIFNEFEQIKNYSKNIKIQTQLNQVKTHKEIQQRSSKKYRKQKGISEMIKIDRKKLWNKKSNQKAKH